MSATNSPFDTETALSQLSAMADGLALQLRQALANYRGLVFTVPGESGDHLDYRDDRNPSGQLSDLGRDVMLSLLKLGLTDEQVAARMSVSTNGVAQRRRAWGRKYGQKG